MNAPRVPLATLPTPLEPLDRLAEALHRPRGSTLIKRDDLTGLAAGGNKTRKLEFLLADAIEHGCDTIVTGAGVQSNHCRQTAAACAHHGLRCVLVLAGARPDRPSGNLVLDQVLGAELRFAPDADDLEATIAATCEELRGQGATPYHVPVGGSVPTGALGYVVAAQELMGQDDSFDLAVLATGSCGTQAGLAAGLRGHERILGVRVGERPDMAERIAGMAAETAALAGLPKPSGTPRLDDRQLGDGYAQPTPAGWEAIRMLGSLEGIVLDPVYTGKGMAALIAGCRDGSIPPTAKVVFIHTGGLPGLLADKFSSWE